MPASVQIMGLLKVADVHLQLLDRPQLLRFTRCNFSRCNVGMKLVCVWYRDNLSTSGMIWLLLRSRVAAEVTGKLDVKAQLTSSAVRSCADDELRFRLGNVVVGS